MPRHDTRFDIRIQLCTDLRAMPIEHAGVEWPEDKAGLRTTMPRLRGFDNTRFPTATAPHAGNSRDLGPCVIDDHARPSTSALLRSPTRIRPAQ